MDGGNHGDRNPGPTLESAQGARPPDRSSAASYPASETWHPDGAYWQKSLRTVFAANAANLPVEKVREISRNPDTPCYLRLREFASKGGRLGHEHSGGRNSKT